MREDEEHPQPEDAPIPRQSVFALVPKRSLYRVLVLLAALVGILYLRARTGAIAGCMADAFRMPMTSPAPVRTAPVRADIRPPREPQSKKAQ
jgi:hypothetical protein